MSQRVDALLDAFRRDEPGDIAIERSPGATEVKVGSDTIARIDERREELVVYAPSDARPMLQNEYQGARSDPAGVAFDLRNDQHAAAGFALLRRRARVQRVGWQYREDSP
ncbi:MAG: hypothetical protein ACLP4R_07675 [Solirubrobacteraceae bacterium]